MNIFGVENRLKALPMKPGVYLFKDKHDKVMYVGKGASLRNRIKSYFSPGSSLTPKLQKLLHNTYDFEYIVADSEQEALIMESNLIKKYRPYYNVKKRQDISLS